MKHKHNMAQQLMVYILLLSLALPSSSCSNLSPPIIPSKEKQISTTQQVSKPKPAAESTSLDNVITHHSDITVTDNSHNKGPDVNSFFPHLAEISVVERTGQLAPIQEFPFNNLNNAHSQTHTIKHKQSTNTKLIKQYIAEKQQHSQSKLTTLEQELLEKIFTTQEGYQLTLYKEGTIWQAEVLEKHGSLRRTHQLDVYIEEVMDLALLRTINKEREKQLIHVKLPKSKKPGYVYVGNWGLKGGGNNKGNSMPAIAGYQLLACLHEGASSNIYRAVKLSDECPVVIKASTQKVLAEKKAQRFRQEFELGQRVHSPYVIRYLELKQDPAYGMALVMEDDQAVELNSIIPPSGFSDRKFLKIAMQIVQGLQAIHAVNIIHNDLKLSNILIQPTTKAIKIIDFNCSSTLRQERQPAISMMAGTLAYISPEQTGRVNRSVDYRTDFYALGIIFYQLLCGELPFTAKDALGLIHQHLAKQPLPPHQHKTTIPLPLSQMVMKLLEKEAENRYQSCEGILHDLTVCLSALNEVGSIPSFKIGQQDFSSKLTLSQHLYGRESQIKNLVNAFERVSKGKCEGLMVAGQPGVGKTMLIQEIQKPITLKQGYFITGKFDQLNKNVAYSALTQAFNSLIQQWLSEDETRIIQWKNQILMALGAQVSLLSKVIPALTQLIGEQSEEVTADISQAKNVFNWIFQEFVKVCATASHPLVIFLDDLQWADQASLELMTYLLQQPNVSHLLWIGAYRDTEVTSSHPALQAIATLQEAFIRVQTLTLTPLSLFSLCQWIADSLQKSLTDIHPLAELIFQKTAGNPFFVKLFLQSLYDEQLLTFAPQTHWQWDLNKIRQHPATENIITLMTYQIQQLPPATQKALSIASCLGHRLALNTLQVAMADSQDTVYQALQPALNSGIMIQINNELHFAHDRVQEAAYHLLPETTKSHTHLTIGQRLLASSAGEEGLLFEVLAQFNRGRLLVNEPKERLRIAHLNLKAAQKAKQATAYAAALDYLYVSQDWVDMKALWPTDYPLAFTFHKGLAEVEYLNGHFETSETLIKDIQPHLQSVLDKVNILRLLIIQKTLQGQLQEAITLGNKALHLLGTKLPINYLDEFIQQKAIELKQKLGDITLSSLLDMPCVVDSEKQAIFSILTTLLSTCYQTGRTELYHAIVLMSINLSLTYGHAPESCISYAAYGYLLCTKFEEYSLGYEFGNLALQLSDKLQSPSQHCQSSVVMLGWIYSWSKCIQRLPALLTAAYEAGLACGELEFAGYFGLSKVLMLFFQGMPLAKVQQDTLPLFQFAQNTKNQWSINTIQAIQRVLANLRGDTPDECNFDILPIHETQFEENCQQANSFFALCIYHILKAQALYLYGYFDQALDQLRLAKPRLGYITANYATALFNWYDSLTRLALYPTVPIEKQQGYLVQITQNQQQMQKWQASCPENFTHKYALVEAEIARVRGHHGQAEAYYDQAIELANRLGFIQEQALAAELATQYWLARGRPLCAQGYLNTAFNGYKQWGAKRKLFLIQAKYADLLKDLVPSGLSHLAINEETTLSSTTLRLLDLSSILKASQTISSEIELPKLLRGMIQIIIENAGAQKGAVLFVEADGTIVVQAEYATDGTITTLQKIPLEDWPNGAHTVIQHVKRLHQWIVIDDATKYEQFRSDPYIIQAQVKSILCVPLLKHAELKAILYVENNLMAHAFTPERVQTVLILTAQMAISLENARYFAGQIALTRQLADQSARAQIAEESLHALTHDLKLALEASKAGTWNWWIDTNKITLDAANYALFGVTPGKFKGTYDAVLECVHPEDRNQLDQHLKYCIEQDIPFDMEYRVIWPDGSQHIIAAQGRVYRNKSGQPIKMAGVCLDITPRRQLEQERLEALQQAEKVQRQRAEEAERYRKQQEEFIDTVCHEIRNPMTGIYGHVDFLKQIIIALETYKTTLTDTSQSALAAPLENLKKSTKTIEHCIKHQKAIIDDVLDLSKLEAGKVSLIRRPFKVQHMIKEATSLFTAQLDVKQLALMVDLPKEAIVIKGDPDRLKIVLVNLLSNAIKFTEKGYIKISLQTQSVSSTHVQLIIQVEDTGIGMTAEEQSYLFQQFSRPLSSQYEGSGLGLSISKKLIDLMGGNIQVHSIKGQSSTFTIYLTCETAHMEEKASPPTHQQLSSPSPSLSSPESRHILVVEDNKTNQKILCKQLELAGYRYTVARNGQQAVEAIGALEGIDTPDKWNKAGFALILMDLEMPVMGGVEATQLIRQKEEQLSVARIPIVGLSAYAREAYMEKAKQAGMEDYLTKPYVKNDLYKVIQQLIFSAELPLEQVTSKAISPL
ncbi:MAG: protein kinase domain-containing protein [Candidatus Amoebophilus sp.]